MKDNILLPLRQQINLLKKLGQGQQKAVKRSDMNRKQLEKNFAFRLNGNRSIEDWYMKSILERLNHSELKIGRNKDHQSVKKCIYK